MIWLLGLGSAWAGELLVHMLDVGQGDSLLIETPAGAHVLVDAGQSHSDVADTLERLGVERLALVVASHAHADHIGGMAEVLNRFPVDLYVDSGLAHTTRTYQQLEHTLRNVRVERHQARAGDEFAVDDEIAIRVIWPGGPRLQGTRSDLNSNSVVLRVEHGEDCFLLTGDMEEPTEHAILRHAVESCEVVKVAHHGSRHSSTTRLLERLEPQFALISVGAENRYGHPGEATLSRLEQVGARVYRTDLTGHITLLSTGTGIHVVDGLDADAPVEAARAVTEIQGHPGETVPMSPNSDLEADSTNEESPESEPTPEEQGKIRWWQRVRQRLTTR